MNINERVKILRKQLKLTQIQFGQKTAISQGHLTAIENGKREVTEKTIKVICSEFNINEAWLRTGEGEMKQTGENPILTELRKKYSLDALDEIILRSFLELKPEQRAAVTAYITKLADEMRAEQERAAADMAGGTQAAPNTQSSAALVSEDEPQTSADLVSEADRAAAHIALDAELNAHDGKKSSPSTGTSTAAN